MPLGIIRWASSNTIVYAWMIERNLPLRIRIFHQGHRLHNLVSAVVDTADGMLKMEQPQGALIHLEFDLARGIKGFLVANHVRNSQLIDRRVDGVRAQVSRPSSCLL